MSEEWGPWIEHDGSCRPVPIGTLVNAIWDDGDETIHRVGLVGSESRMGFVLEEIEGTEGGWIWAVTPPDYAKIVRYRLHRPHALRELISMIAVLPVDEVAPA